jgi:DNA polymerase III subunit epsilon
MLRQLFARRSLPDVGSTQRWVVVDVESSGLNYRRDKLLAIAALAVHQGADGLLSIDVAHHFEVVLQQEQPSAHDNILIHGIGVSEQVGGVPANQALEGFRNFIADSPLLAFHAVFDQTLIARGFKKQRLPLVSNIWIDLEPLCYALYPDIKAKALDDWLAYFQIECLARHNASADTLATAELFLRLWPRLKQQGVCSGQQLQQLAEHSRWLRQKGAAF